MKVINYRLQQKLGDIFTVEPNDLGNGLFTRVYHQLTAKLKTIPFIYVIPLAFAGAVLLYFIFGVLVVRLVNLLQYGF